MSSAHQHNRTRSQSRFPASNGGLPLLEDVSTLNKSQRSKSFDNRREFFAPYAVDNMPANNQPPTTQFVGGIKKRQGTRDSFFNDSITIPIHKSGSSEFNAANSNVNLIVEKNIPPGHHRSMNEGIDRSAGEANDDHWTSYDKTVKYNHNKTEFPFIPVPTARIQEDYSQHSLDANWMQIRYPESNYASQINHSQQNLYQKQSSHQPFRQQQREGAYRTNRQSDYGRQSESAYRPIQNSFYNDDYGASTFGRAGAAGAGGGGQRHYHHHHESHHRESGGGDSGKNRHYAAYNQQYLNGSGNKSAVHFKNHVYTNNNSNGTGFFVGSKKIDNYLPMQKRQTIYHKVHCCCFSFKWPPWSYERCEPPTPIFYSRKDFNRGLQFMPSAKMHGFSPQHSPQNFGSPPPFTQQNNRSSPTHNVYIPPPHVLHSLPTPLHTSQTAPGRLTPNMQY